jgi:hypothetical protein
MLVKVLGGSSFLVCALPISSKPYFALQKLTFQLLQFALSTQGLFGRLRSR